MNYDKSCHLLQSRFLGRDMRLKSLETQVAKNIIAGKADGSWLAKDDLYLP